MDELFALLKAKGLTIACAESLTGGMFMSELTGVPDVSQVFQGGVVCYANEIKRDIVGVSPEVLAQYGAVSAQCAAEMARGVQQRFKVDVAVSFTGNAGPAVLEGKPAGLVYTCLRIGDAEYGYCDRIDRPRNPLRRRIVELTCRRLIERLGKPADENYRGER